jgi:hypothetical protein
MSFSAHGSSTVQSSAPPLLYDLFLHTPEWQPDVGRDIGGRSGAGAPLPIYGNAADEELLFEEEEEGGEGDEGGGANGPATARDSAGEEEEDSDGDEGGMRVWCTRTLRRRAASMRGLLPDRLARALGAPSHATQLRVRPERPEWTLLLSPDGLALAVSTSGAHVTGGATGASGASGLAAGGGGVPGWGAGSGARGTAPRREPAAGQPPAPPLFFRMHSGDEDFTGETTIQCTPPPPVASSPRLLAWSSDSLLLAATGGDGLVHVYFRGSGQRVYVLEPGACMLERISLPLARSSCFSYLHMLYACRAVREALPLPICALYF